MIGQDDLRAHQGYLLLADISGYTAFLTGTELEHAHAIVRELTRLIRERLAQSNFYAALIAVNRALNRLRAPSPTLRLTAFV